METRKRGYKEYDPEKYKEIVDIKPKRYVSSKKFFFQYSKHKDGAIKNKSPFLSFNPVATNNSIFLNYTKENESITIPRYLENTSPSFDDECIRKYLTEKIKYLMIIRPW